MSTSAIIALQTNEKDYKAAYVHYDGYLDYLGGVLLDHYQDRAKTDELVNLGAMSSVGAEISGEADYRGHGKTKTISYQRDYGEEESYDNRTQYYNNVDADDLHSQEYLYVYGLDGVWRYMEHDMIGLEILTDEMTR